uniref:Uncharacterized protein n=2 Tax=Cacopsylla melanoneura TaxID=428564 RepID=A0A8D8VJT8_9HEMI
MDVPTPQNYQKKECMDVSMPQTYQKKECRSSVFQQTPKEENCGSKLWEDRIGLQVILLDFVRYISERKISTGQLLMDTCGYEKMLSQAYFLPFHHIYNYQLQYISHLLGRDRKLCCLWNAHLHQQNFAHQWSNPHLGRMKMM